jgi:hypothetical protein
MDREGKRMGTVLRGIAALVLGVALGLGATWFMLDRAIATGGVSNGPWSTSLTIGAPEAGPYVRAAVAVAGLLALDRREAVYLTAYTDSDGRPLDGRCRYRLEGGALPARWWSITAYGADHFLIPNDQKTYSFTSDDATRLNNTIYIVHLSSTPPAGQGGWIPVREGEPFSLTLRLYNPREGTLERLRTVPLPRIRRESC